MRPVPAGAVLLVVSVIVGAPLRARADAAQARAHFEKGRTFFSSLAAAPLPSASAPATEPAVLIAKPASEPASGDGDQGKPFYKRGWFFAAVGVVLLGGAVGIWAATRNPTQVPGTPLGNQGTSWQ